MDNKNTTWLIIGGLAALFFFFSRGASASEKEKKIGPKPSGKPKKPSKSKGSPKRCDISGEEYNADKFRSPASVMILMKQLGFGPEKHSNVITSPEWKKAIKKFQAMARSRGLRGMKGASEKYVDGIVGACTLLALEDASEKGIMG